MCPNSALMLAINDLTTHPKPEDLLNGVEARVVPSGSRGREEKRCLILGSSRAPWRRIAEISQMKEGKFQSCFPTTSEAVSRLDSDRLLTVVLDSNAHKCAKYLHHPPRWSSPDEMVFDLMVVLAPNWIWRSCFSLGLTA